MTDRGRRNDDGDQLGPQSRAVGGNRLGGGLWWRIFTAFVTVSALIAVLLLFADAWPKILEHRSSIDFSLLAAGLLLALIAAYLTFIPFADIAHERAGVDLPLLQMAHLYFTSQLLKHLPGRVWGIGYQMVAGGQSGAKRAWLSVNILHMLLATFFGLSSSAIVLAFDRDWRAGVLVVAASLACYQMIWSSVSVIKWSARRIRIVRRFQEVLPSIESVSGSTRIRLLLIFASSWLAYYVSWYFFGLSYPPVGGAGGIRMCALYFLAWFVGYISLVTPSGLGIRELAFAWLAKDFPPDAVAMMAIVGRVNLLSVDVILGLMFAPFSPRDIDRQPI